MIIEYLWLFALLALVAEIMGTVGGFGSSLFFVPMAGYFLDLHTVLGITALYHVMSNLTKIGFFRHGFDKMLILYIGIPSVIMVIIGAWLSQFLGAKNLELILAVVLILLSVLFLIFDRWQVKPTKFNAASGGVLSGFLAGLIGTGGAIRGMVLTSFRFKKEAFIATSAAIDLAIDASRSVVYTANGYVHVHDLYLIPVLLVVSIVGTWIGKKLLNHISETQFRKVVLILILATGLFTLRKALLTNSNIIHQQLNEIIIDN
ncbi:MAG: TSUP family transporter [Bacteroidetes bacterium]|nr:TSUP family transporter [Bacteroidota bacterium]